MSKTRYEIKGNDFYINGKKTYDEIKNGNENVKGLLFNARFIQGMFDDVNPDNKGMYDRFGKKFNAKEHTQDLVDNLDKWYDVGLRAITVGLQGGGPIFTYEDWSVIETGSFSKDGKTLDAGYKQRLEMILKKADEIGMIVIVSILYQAQIHYFEDDVAIVNSIRTACEYLKTLPYDNIIIELVNEFDVPPLRSHPTINTPQSIAYLITLAKEWCDNRFAIGCSGTGAYYDKLVAQYSDVILFHGNMMRTETYARLVQKIKNDFPNKPIVCNEDSPRFSHFKVCEDYHVSWGYYNNYTKQEPPAFWNIKKGEDEFFAKRMSMMINGEKPCENELYLEGLEENSEINGGHYVKVASLYPEQLDYVKYYEDGKLLDVSYEEPFLMYSLTTWEQKPYIPTKGAKEFRAVVHLANHETKEFIHKL